MWQQFTETSRRAIVKSEQEAAQAQCEKVGTEHLLLGLLSEVDSAASQILESYGLTAEKIRSEFKADSEVVGRKRHLSTPEIEESKTHFQVDPELVHQLESRLLRKLRGQNEKPELQLSPQVKRVLELAADEARRTQQEVKHSNGIGTEHLLLGLLHDKGGYATKTLCKLGLNLEETRMATIKYLQSKDEK